MTDDPLPRKFIQMEIKKRERKIALKKNLKNCHNCTCEGEIFTPKNSLNCMALFDSRKPPPIKLKPQL